ncbi:MAG: hypothetical protein WBL50_21110, partial [Candidatus Acidiferrum sp.]
MIHKSSSIRAIILAAVALLTAIPAVAQTTDQAPAAKPKSTTTKSTSKSNAIPIPDIPYTKFVLPNGLTVLI